MSQGSIWAYALQHFYQYLAWGSQRCSELQLPSAQVTMANGSNDGSCSSQYLESTMLATPACCKHQHAMQNAHNFSGTAELKEAHSDLCHHPVRDCTLCLPDKGGNSLAPSTNPRRSSRKELSYLLPPKRILLSTCQLL